MTIVIIIAIVVALSGGGTVIASQNALPGDFLYPVKIDVEDFRLMLAADEKDSDLYLLFANERLEEMNSLLDQGRIEDALLATQRFEMQVNAYVQLNHGTADPEHLAVLETLQQSYGFVVDRVSNAQNLDEAGKAMVSAWLENEEEVTTLLAFGVNTAQNGFILVNNSVPFDQGEYVDDHNSAYPAPETNTPQPTEEDDGEDESEEGEGAYPAPATTTPTHPGGETSPTSQPSYTATSWPTFTATATYYFPPTAQPTHTSQPTNTPTNKPTDAGYPAPVTPTNQPTQPGYPPPATPTSQPTQPGYPAPPTAQPTQPGYPPPPQPTATPLPQPTATPLPQPTQQGYPPPPQPTEPGYP